MIVGLKVSCLLLIVNNFVSMVSSGSLDVSSYADEAGEPPYTK